MVLGIVFVAFSNYFAVYTAPLVRQSVDYIKKAIDNNYVAREVNSTLIYYAFIITGVALLNGLFMFFMRQTIIVMSRFIEYDLKNEVYEHYQKLDLAFYKRNNTGDLMNRISEDVSRVRMYIGPAVMYVVNTLGTLLFTIVFMLRVDVKLSLYVLLPLPVLAIAIYYVSAAINNKSTLVQEQLSGIFTHAQEAFSGIRILKAYSKENFSAQEFEKKSELFKCQSLSLAKTEALFQPFMILLIGLSTITTIYIGGMQAISGKISIGNIAEFVVYVNRLIWPVASLGWVTSLIQRAAASQTRINEFLDAKPSVVNQNNIPEIIHGDIEFRNVSFTYPDSGIQALNDISFKVKQGTSLAIIGKTGSGKSSIAALLCRLYELNPDTGGEILIDGREIKNVNLNSLRRQTGYVPQEAFLFSDSIFNNISFSVSPDTSENNFTKEAVEQAAKDAAIYNDVVGFPKQFDTVVGERGITLSGGQKQRVSIARAIIKAPKLLIFDDCLSAVDIETEQTILNALQRIMKGRTSVIISHRISSVKYAHHIIMLEKGKIIEEGTHENLLNKKGNYYELYQLQLSEKKTAAI